MDGAQRQYTFGGAPDSDTAPPSPAARADPAPTALHPIAVSGTDRRTGAHSVEDRFMLRKAMRTDHTTMSQPLSSRGSGRVRQHSDGHRALPTLDVQRTPYVTMQRRGPTCQWTSTTSTRINTVRRMSRRPPHQCCRRPRRDPRQTSPLRRTCILRHRMVR